ncbi:unnamed protein product [Protopolystoma xenopodis]|uniref:Uncharacterized protein n=1 Tax=Protopolystoma xenopodis TaxID=117903 RepID=A0A3S5CHT9_9PLAT|nr:unnamed protein product [Protopolystoma xenopodis]
MIETAFTSSNAGLSGPHNNSAGIPYTGSHLSSDFSSSSEASSIVSTTLMAHQLARVASANWTTRAVFARSPASSLRRCAIDLIGRGLDVWEAFLDTGQLLNALLNLAAPAEDMLQRSDLYIFID